MSQAEYERISARLDRIEILVEQLSEKVDELKYVLLPRARQRLNRFVALFAGIILGAVITEIIRIVF
jgi:tetrahydromethanopterin S-methyltransferase subunit G